MLIGKGGPTAGRMSGRGGRAGCTCRQHDDLPKGTVRGINMNRSLLFYCLLVLFAFPVNAQESSPLGALKLDLTCLKTWGTKSYTYEATRPGSSEKMGEGRFTLKTTVTSDGVTLDDTMALMVGDGGTVAEVPSVRIVRQTDHHSPALGPGTQGSPSLGVRLCGPRLQAQCTHPGFDHRRIPSTVGRVHGPNATTTSSTCGGFQSAGWTTA